MIFPAPGGRGSGRIGSALRWFLALGGSAVLIAALILMQPRGEGAAAPGAPTPEPTSAAPPAAVERVHSAVHRVGSLCRARADGNPGPSLRPDVDLVLQFARRYPDGRFPIDDETGSALSLLLVLRETLQSCSPEEAARVDRALPADFQDWPPAG